MRTTRRADHNFWWSGDPTERFWIEVLKTDEYGDRLFAPDTPRYKTMHGVEVGDVVFHWLSERHPRIGSKRGGLYAVSRATGPLQRSASHWDKHDSLEMSLTPRVYLRRPVLLEDLKRRRDDLAENLDVLEEAISPMKPHSLWQFTSTGLKPHMTYLAKFTTADLELITADHPHIVTALGLV